MNNVVIGRRGLGKSTLAEHIALGLNPNLVIFDANNQFHDAEIRTSDLDELRDALEDSGHDDQHPISVAFIPQGEVEEDWNRFAHTIWEYGDYSLIIDEAHRLQKPQYVNTWLDKFMRQAPRRERNDKNPIDVVQTFHRPTDLNGIVLGLCDYAYIFRTTKVRDLEWIEKEWGSDLREQVQTLSTPQTNPSGRDVLKVEVESPEHFELITDPRSWFVNIRESRKQKSIPERISKSLEESFYVN